MSYTSAQIEQLNEKQLEAVTSERTNMLIFAGAGSGKTKVLVSRIAYFMAVEHLLPHNIMAVTFTNKAANEMKQRVVQLVKDEFNVSSMMIGTFHGICNRLLRKYAKQAELPYSYTIIDAADQLAMVKRIMNEMTNIEFTFKPQDAVSFISRAKEKGIRAENSLKELDPSNPESLLYSKIYSTYEERCNNSGVVDFSELILRVCEMLEKNASVRQVLHNQYKEILVDEFQDSNDMQLRFIQLLKGEDAHITVVGDDDQSIYSWRGANPNNLLQIAKHLSDIKEIKLEQNYRSNAHILAVANEIIQRNTDRVDKCLWTDREGGEKVKFYSAVDGYSEAEYVVSTIRKLHQEEDLNYSDIAILYRNNFLSLNFENELMKANIPYRIVAGHRFYDRQEIKDAIAYVRLLVNPNDDVAFARVVNVPPRGVGNKTVNALIALGRENNLGLLSTIELAIKHGLVKGKGKTGLSNFWDLIIKLKQTVDGETLDSAIGKIINESGLYTYYSDYEKKEKDVGRSRTGNLDELVSMCAGYGFSDATEHYGLDALLQFMQDITLDEQEHQQSDDDPLDNDKVNLLTIHTSKGLEFDTVFVVAFENGILPYAHADSKESEEVRLAYVAVTRAKNRCYLSYARSRLLYGNVVMSTPSPFLQGLDRSHIEYINADNSLASIFKKRMACEPSPFKLVSLGKDQEKCDLEVGNVVLHDKFGKGVVEKVLLDSNTYSKVWVKFENGRVNCLNPKFAKLKKL